MASVCYQRLRSDIRAGRFKPGERLRIAAFTQEFKTGLSPVREALNRLAADGFVAQSDQRGFRIPPATVKELLELTRTRCMIAEITLRDSIVMGGKDWEERLVLAHYRISRSRYDESPDFEDHHAEFHNALISACPSPWLLTFSEKLTELAERYRAMGRNAAGAENVEAAMQEHDQIYEAALKRDVEAAIGINQAHIRRASEVILSTKALFEQGLIEGEWREEPDSAMRMRDVRESRAPGPALGKAAARRRSGAPA